MWKAAFPYAFAPESLEAKRGPQLIMVSRGPLAIWHGLLLLLLLPLPSHGGPALRPPLPSQVQEWGQGAMPCMCFSELCWGFALFFAFLLWPGSNGKRTPDKNKIIGCFITGYLYPHKICVLKPYCPHPHH